MTMRDLDRHGTGRRAPREPALPDVRLLRDPVLGLAVVAHLPLALVVLGDRLGDLGDVGRAADGVAGAEAGEVDGPEGAGAGPDAGGGWGWRRRVGEVGVVAGAEMGGSGEGGEGPVGGEREVVPP